MTGSRCTLVEGVLEHGKRAWSCYQVHLQHPVILSKALFPKLVPFPLEQTLSIHGVCEQEFTAQGHPGGGTPSYTVSWICHLPLSSAGVPFLYQKERVVDPLFQQLSWFHKLLGRAPRFSSFFFRLFCPLLLLLLIQKLFQTFDQICCPFLKLFQPLYTFLRKTRAAGRIEGMSESQICVVTWWWWPVSSLSLSWQSFIPAFPQPAHSSQARIVPMELSTITQSFYCWEKQSAHFSYMKLGLFPPALHICLHQISSVVLLPTQPSKLLLQLCTIIFAILNKLLTSYHQQTSLLSSMTGLNSTSLCTDFICFFFP